MRRFAIALLLATIPAGAFAAEDDGSCSSTTDEREVITLGKDCFAMIDAQPTDAAKADLLFRFAYALNGQDSAETSLPLLDRAIALVPNDPKYLQERGYTRGDLGDYRGALADLDKALTLDGRMALALSERAWTRAQLGDFAGSAADYARAAELDGAKPEYVFGQAEALVWLGRFDEAETAFATIEHEAAFANRVARLRASIARVRAYKTPGSAAKTCTDAQDISEKPAAAAIVDACTVAYLAAADDAARAEYLTGRAVAIIVEESGYDNAIQDYKLATGLDPENPDWHVNFGYVLLAVNHSWAARNEFAKALVLGPHDDQRKAFALAGRAQANYNLGETDAAFADAKASFEVEPTEPALDILGQLSFDRGDKEAAKLYWMGEYHMGARDDGLIASLAKVDVTEPDKEPASDR